MKTSYGCDFMSDKNIINFEDAKAPHALQKKEDKLAKIKKAFKAARSNSGVGEGMKEKKGKNRKKKKGGKDKKS